MYVSTKEGSAGADPYGLQTLQQDLVWLEKLEHRKKMVKAVIIARHCNSLMLRRAILNPEQDALVQSALAAWEETKRLRAHVEVCANAILQTQKLQVPLDLSPGTQLAQ